MEDNNRIGKIRMLFQLKAGEERDGRHPNLSFLERQTDITRKTIRKYLGIAAARGLSAETLADLPPEEFEKIFPSGQFSQQMVDPDLKAVYEYMRPAGMHKKEDLPTLQQAWLACYVRPNFDVPEEKLNINWLRLSNLPEGCLSFGGFRKRYDHYCKLVDDRNANLRPTRSSKSAPGAVMEADGVGDKCYWKDYNDNTRVCRAFTAVLKHSGLIFMGASDHATTLDWASFLINAFDYFGGTAAALKTDNDSALVNKKLVKTREGKSFYARTPNQTLRFLASAYGMDIILADIYKPRAKASVERAVGITETLLSSCLELREKRFHDVSEVNELLKRFSDDYNGRLTKGYTYTHRSFFELYEKPYLQPLPEVKPEMRKIREAKVSERSYVRYRGNDYAVKTAYKGKKVYVQELDNGTINILDSDFRLLVNYELDLEVGTSVRRHVAPKLRTPAEKYTGRDLNDFLKIAEESFQEYGSTLPEVLRFLFDNAAGNNIDITHLCNKMLKTLDNNKMSANRLKTALQCVLDNKICQHCQVTGILESAISTEVKPVINSNRKKLNEQLKELPTEGTNENGRAYYVGVSARLTEDTEVTEGQDEESDEEQDDSFDADGVRCEVKL